jgi:hypothetical protein
MREGFYLIPFSADGTQGIVKAMQKVGVQRFISESSLGAGDSKGRLGLLYTYGLIPLFLRGLFADKEVQERIIRDSSLDWVIMLKQLTEKVYLRMSPGVSY